MASPLTVAKKVMASSKRNDYTDHGVKNGYRSGFEERISQELSASQVSYTYEQDVIKYTIPERVARYTPDFKIGDMFIETKGRFTSADRKKHTLIKKQFPSLDIRFVFSNSKTKIGKKSKTTYGMWCEKLGIPYADKSIPREWIECAKS